MTHHPCGALPVHTISAHAWYCEHHMAWWASVSRWVEAADEHLEVLDQKTMEFGPFDTPEEVRDFLMRWLTDGLVAPLAPDAPWDRRREPRTT